MLVAQSQTGNECAEYGTAPRRRRTCVCLFKKNDGEKHDKRGKEIVLERGIDIEERRIDIDRMFKETLGVLVQTARHQAEHGQEEFYVDQDGRKSMKRRVGIDPRIAGELSRSLNRWAEFCGLLERAPEQNNAITMVQLAAPSDGASFSDKWATAPAEGQTVDVTAEAERPGQGPAKELPEAKDQSVP